jgi:hypothetical protein
MSIIMSRKLEVKGGLITNSPKTQRITKVVFKRPIIQWLSNRGWKRSRHLTVSTVTIQERGETFIETIAFPGHHSLFRHSQCGGFALDLDRYYPVKDHWNFDKMAEALRSQEERMIRRLTKSCIRSFTY